MSPQVFYQKWRPQTLAEVVGQEHITQTLANALASNRIAHAYLFCGPRGTGKTSTGRILAKAVNCLENGKGDPCNNCQICTDINEGRDLDLIEIDAASNTGVDDIRKLRENVNYSPDLARYKVYIIDEVHMLSTSAFNALLKTLEEPPAHVIFVLATTEIHKIPATILSRCQRFDFKRISLDAVIGRLEYICKEEGITVDPHAMTLVAKAATGSLRDAENLLERLTISHSSNIGIEHVQELLGITGDQRAGQVAKYILQKDVTAGISAVNGIANDGLDLRQFSKEVVEHLRGILMIKIGAGDTLDLTKDAEDEMKQIASAASADRILEAIKLLGQVNLNAESQSTIPLELAIVELSLPKATTTAPVQPAPVQKPAPIKQQAPPLIQAPPPIQAQPPAPKVEAAVQQQTPPPIQQQPPVQTTPAAEEAKTGANELDGLPLGEKNLEYIQKNWHYVIQALRGVGSTGNLDALLRSACDPIDLDDHTIVLGFYYPFHKDKIEDPKYGHMVENTINKVFGNDFKIRCILTPREKKQQKKTLLDTAIEMGAEIINDNPGGNQ